MSSMSSTASTSTASDQRPPNRPLFVEPNHFYSKRSLDLIRQHLSEICTHLGIDVMPGSSNFSMKCSTYVEYASVEFLMSIFTDDIGTEERYLIEIQRRSGDGYAFQETMAGLRASLYDRKVIEKSASPVKRSWGEKAKAAIAARTKSCGPDALARLQAIQNQDADGCVFRSVSHAPAAAYSSFPIVETDDVVVASVNHSVRLAGSSYDDVKAEALRAMAGMASKEQSQRALLATIGDDGQAGEGVKIAVLCLQSFTPDVHRCAASTLANLLSASSAEVASEARELVRRHNGADELFRLILREKSEQQPESVPVSPQVLRECARALISMYGGSHTPKSASAISAIQKLRSHYCPVVREYADRLDDVFTTL